MGRQLCTVSCRLTVRFYCVRFKVEVIIWFSKAMKSKSCVVCSQRRTESVLTVATKMNGIKHFWRRFAHWLSFGEDWGSNPSRHPKNKKIVPCLLSLWEKQRSRYWWKNNVQFAAMVPYTNVKRRTRRWTVWRRSGRMQAETKRWLAPVSTLLLGISWPDRNNRRLIVTRS